MHARFSSRARCAIALVIAFASTMTVRVAQADASGLFKQLAGSWRGSGALTLSDGRRERISCRGYYVPKSGGEALSIAILCNSPNQKIEIRSRVQEVGQRVSGEWEERTFHAVGQVSGRATGNNMHLAVSGSISGTISISLKGKSHSVAVSATGTGFRNVSISLSRG
jgi:hypothetical protein